MAGDKDHNQKPVISLEELIEGGKRDDRTNPVTGVTKEKRVNPAIIAAVVVAALILVFVLRKVMNSG
jgi:hypothetical protein